MAFRPSYLFPCSLRHDPELASYLRIEKGANAQVSASPSIFCSDPMHGRYDRLMKRGEAARRLIAQGEDPVRMLLAAVWPDHDWAGSALHTQLTHCPRCSDRTVGCEECGGTGLVTVTRRKLLAIEDSAAAVYDAA